jgi:uncharacterized protein
MTTATVAVSAIGGRRLAAASNRTPDAPTTQPTQAHTFSTEHGHHALVVDGSRVYDVPEGFAQQLLDAAQQEGPAAEQRLLAALGLQRDEAQGPYIGTHIDTPAVNAIALAVSQHCNLGCGYCYAEGGSFGSEAQHMPWPVAEAAVDRLLDSVGPGGTARIAFLGGEPLLNRAVLQQTTEYATQQAQARGQTLQLAMTTNATVLNADDAAFLAHHGFAVTISMDGERELHDTLRPTRGGTGSYDRIVTRLPALLALQGQAPMTGRQPMQVTARVTVTPLHHNLRGTVEHLMDLGFHSVGVSPSLSAQDPSLQLAGDELQALLAQMIDCAQEFERRTLRGEHYPFSNMLGAMRELHRGTHRPLPCGAGAGYLGVAADGALSACHRFVGDPRADMGSVRAGVDDAARAGWLAQRHVDRQEPCRSCWARYLCGGGCHHEVLNRGRVACDFIRGWLDHCLHAYVRLAEQRPQLFA